MKNSKDNKTNWSEREGNAIHSFEFVGVIIVYLLKLGREDSNSVAHPKNSKRNTIVGNVFCGILLILCIVLTVKFL